MLPTLFLRIWADRRPFFLTVAGLTDPGSCAAGFPPTADAKRMPPNRSDDSSDVIDLKAEIDKVYELLNGYYSFALSAKESFNEKKVKEIP
ncbi:hypothetical protein [Bacillus licheniformis]|uniref:hypothetical protein n=1 Tax=Bacillus licheniformis TaxID=1402 RepID=UPI0011A60A18|nr:hypothetical protein [Bacillus licheniformis]